MWEDDGLREGGLRKARRHDEGRAACEALEKTGHEYGPDRLGTCMATGAGWAGVVAIEVLVTRAQPRRASDHDEARRAPSLVTRASSQNAARGRRGLGRNRKRG